MSSKLINSVLSLIGVLAAIHFFTNMCGSSEKQNFTDHKKSKEPEVKNESNEFFPYKGELAKQQVPEGIREIPMMSSVDQSEPKEPLADDEFYDESDLPSKFVKKSDLNETKKELSEMQKKLEETMKKSVKKSDVKPFDNDYDEYGEVVSDKY